MAVKRWPHWPELVTALAAGGRTPLVVSEPGADPGRLVAGYAGLRDVTTYDARIASRRASRF